MDINSNWGVCFLVLFPLKKKIYSNQIFIVADLSIKQEVIKIKLVFSKVFC